MASQKINRQFCSLQYILVQTLRNNMRFPGTNSIQTSYTDWCLDWRPTYFEYEIASSAPDPTEQLAGGWDVTYILSQISQKVILLSHQDALTYCITYRCYTCWFQKLQSEFPKDSNRTQTSKTPQHWESESSFKNSGMHRIQVLNTMKTGKTRKLQ